MAVRTVNDIKTQALNYLGFSVPVDFDTPDEVGAVINRVYDDALEKAYRMYPWSFCRKDGVIDGIQYPNATYEHFSHYAKISDFLFRIVPSSATIAQTTGTSLTRLEVNVEMFENAVRNAMNPLDKDSYLYEQLEDLLNKGGDLQFTFVNTGKWNIIGQDGTIVINDIKTYGITWYKRDEPVVDDVLTVSYVQPIKENAYIAIQAAFYDPKHYVKCFDWKQYGTDLIKFQPKKLYVEYTIAIDPQYYPAYFSDYLALAVAIEACAPLRLESKLPILTQQLEAVFLDARKQDSLGEPTPASFDNIIDEARNIL